MLGLEFLKHLFDLVGSVVQFFLGFFLDFFVLFFQFSASLSYFHEVLDDVFGIEAFLVDFDVPFDYFKLFLQVLVMLLQSSVFMQ